MKIEKNKTIKICCAFLLFFCNKIYSQQANFSGEWKMKDQHSITGKLYRNGSPMSIYFIQDSLAIIIKETTFSVSGDFTSNDTLRFGNKTESVTPLSKRKKIIHINWSLDKSTLIETTELYSATNNNTLEFKITDIFKLLNNELIFDRKNENFTNEEVWESSASYLKK